MSRSLNPLPGNRGRPPRVQKYPILETACARARPAGRRYVAPRHFAPLRDVARVQFAPLRVDRTASASPPPHPNPPPQGGRGPEAPPPLRGRGPNRPGLLVPSPLAGEG